MSRDRFISDNLYNMRERFKRNHVEHQGSPAPVEPMEPVENSAAAPAIDAVPGQPETPVIAEPAAPTPEPAPTSEPVNRLPRLNAPVSNGENAREYREIEGRLLRDLSFIDAETEISRQRTEAMTRFRATAEELLRELSSDTLTPRQFDQLRIKYFQACGSFEAAMSQRSKAENTVEHSPVAPIRSWPLATAIIASALIISLTLLLLFGR